MQETEKETSQRIDAELIINNFWLNLLTSAILNKLYQT